MSRVKVNRVNRVTRVKRVKVNVCRAMSRVRVTKFRVTRVTTVPGFAVYWAG